MDWKAILALAVLVAPVAYCTAESERARIESGAMKQIACIDAGGNWATGWGGYCKKEEG